MSDLFLADGSYPACSYHPRPCVAVRRQPAQCQPPPPPHAQALPAQDVAVFVTPPQPQLFTSKAESARQSRNRAEKQRRDKMNESISVLASIVPPVVMAGRKVDKTSVLRLTAHYLRSHKHVFGRSIRRGPRFSPDFTQSILKTLKGFILTTTYKGLVVVVSQNVQEFLGYTELELLGQNLYNFVHPEDHQLLTEQLFPRSCNLTSNGELLLSNEPEAEEKAAEALKNEKRAFLIRFKKLTYPRSTPTQYVTCHVEGSFRKSDGAGVYVDKRVQVGRRLRSRGNNPYASGNDIVFVGMIRPVTETFTTESRIESFKMEYRTRHSIDGSIIQCEHRISIVTGYMTNEVTGVNAMHFMHRNDVRWVVVALREMYVHHRLMGESCYRLMMKNGKFVYMRTTGALDVNPDSKEATSFICTNTVVSESEGVELIKQMKKKFSYKINNEEPMNANLTGNPEVDQSLPVEDPRQLEQVIYHLVTDLPSPQEENDHERRETSNPELAIIPPKREQIRKAIEKSYSIIRTLRTSEPRSRSYFTSMCDERSPYRSANDRSENDTEEQININRCAWCYKFDHPDTRVSDTHNMVDNNRSSSPGMHTGLLSEHSHGMSFNEACGVTPDDDIECGGSWNPLISTQADLFQLPEDVSSFMECSFFDLDSSVSFEHDFELSQMDVERLLSTLNDENLLETAAQACEALNEANIDDGEQPAPEAMDVQEHPDDPYEFREENEIIYQFSLWKKKDKDKDKI